MLSSILIATLGLPLPHNGAHVLNEPKHNGDHVLNAPNKHNGDHVLNAPKHNGAHVLNAPNKNYHAHVLNAPNNTAKTLSVTATQTTAVSPAVAAIGVACTYIHSNVVAYLAGNLQEICDRLPPLGWTIAESYNLYTEQTMDTDSADVFTSGGDCLLSFHGADAHEFFGGGYLGNLTAVAPTSYYGVDAGFMTIFTEELEAMFNAIRSKHGSLANWASTMCPNSLSVAGHSMGGGMAAVFAYLANKESDPLSLNKRVSALYQFGSNPAASTQLTNDQSADGCFAGGSYYMRVPADDNGEDAYADGALILELAPTYGSMLHPKIGFMSLDTVGPITDKTNLLGPVVSTPCGTTASGNPPVIDAMLADADLTHTAESEGIISLGATIGLHEAVAVADSF